MKITEEERNAVYKTIYSRRDVRGQFLDTPIDDKVLNRILTAAHHAPSVGFMQPWDFIIVRSDKTKTMLKEAFDTASSEASTMFDDDRSNLYQKLKLEGIMEAPVGICITCDRTRSGPVVIGRTHQPEMDLYSAVCAVQTLWLAARAENLGVGWVSIMDKKSLKNILNIPDNIEAIAYLCIGHVSHFKDKPELEECGWLPRLNVDNVVHSEKMGKIVELKPI